MNKIKIFLKVVYYFFMVIVVLLMSLVLPTDNKNTLMNDYIKSSIKEEKYEQIPNMFSSYFNDDAVVSKDVGDYHIEIFEAQSVNAINTSSQFYSNSIYMGFIFNSYNYNFTELKDANDKTYNYTNIKINNNNDNLIAIPQENFTYQSQYGMVYFEINEFDFYKSNLTSIASLEFIQNDGSSYLKLDNIDLSFTSSFFTQANEYNLLYNSGYFNLPLTLTGSFTKNIDSTTVGIGSTLKFQTAGETLLAINSSNQFTVTSNGVLLNPNDRTYTYTFPASTDVVITAQAETKLNQIKVTYDNNLSYIYSFDDLTEEHVAKTYYYTQGNTTLGDSYNEDEIYNEYEAWKTTYSFTSSNYNEVVANSTPMAFGQVLLIILGFLILGDFLVGKKWILTFIKFIIRKFKKQSPNDSTTEIAQEFNDYEVNVECKIIVPEAFDSEIHLVYQMENSDITMTFDLTKKDNYKLTNRYRNGIYNLKEFQAAGLELVEPKTILNVRGYKYVLELTTKSNN